MGEIGRKTPNCGLIPTLASTLILGHQLFTTITLPYSPRNYQVTRTAPPHVLGGYTDISQADVENKDLDVKFTNTELGGLKDDLTRLQQQNKIKDERIGTLQSTIEEMQRNMAMIAEVLAVKPTVAEVQRALEKKRRSILSENENV